jgi:hypothetical protein
LFFPSFNKGSDSFTLFIKTYDLGMLYSSLRTVTTSLKDFGLNFFATSFAHPHLDATSWSFGF